MREEYPAPEVLARMATRDEICRGAWAVGQRARGAGWEVLPTYARGWTPHARDGSPLRVVDCLALRMRHGDGRRCVAVWHDGRFDQAFRVSPDPGRISRNELLEFLDNLSIVSRSIPDGIEKDIPG